MLIVVGRVERGMEVRRRRFDRFTDHTSGREINVVAIEAQPKTSRALHKAVAAFHLSDKLANQF